ncbi:MAG TPA: hypothetical protein PLC65_20235, partial [Bacteroidia bacterium]|nr:hypothetical protein [Bacteroidia bacterium]
MINFILKENKTDFDFWTGVISFNVFGGSLVKIIILNSMATSLGANTVADYLITKGVELNRVTYKGYGSTKP